MSSREQPPPHGGLAHPRSSGAADRSLDAAATTPEDRLRGLGLELPATPRPTGSYVGAVRAGDLVFVAGHAAAENGRFIEGLVGGDTDLAGAQRAARIAVLYCLSTLKAEIDELSRVRRIVKLVGMVHATPDFADLPAVVDGASDLLLQLFLERGRHARSAIGMSALPHRSAVEIEIVAQICK
jgi:enamine deaminase RidA (YjgF/YER057c/UK114 family)